MLREWRLVLRGTEWVVVCLDPNTSLGSGRLQTAAAACGNHKAHANEIKQWRHNGGSIHLCGVNTITEMTVCVFPSSDEQQERPLAGVNNPVCTAGRDWLEGGGQEGRDEHSLQPDDLFNYLGKTMSFCTHYTWQGFITWRESLFHPLNLPIPLTHILRANWHIKGSGFVTVYRDACQKPKLVFMYAAVVLCFQKHDIASYGS